MRRTAAISGAGAVVRRAGPSCSAFSKQRGMVMEQCLNEIKPGESAVVERLRVHGNMRRRLLDIGLVEGTRVECVGVSPMGDPAAYCIRGAVIAIRAADSRGVLVRRAEDGTDI